MLKSDLSTKQNMVKFQFADNLDEEVDDEMDDFEEVDPVNLATLPSSSSRIHSAQ